MSQHGTDPAEGIAGLIGTDRPLSQVYDVLLLDLDGVVYIGADAVPGAADALVQARKAGMGASFVTNNASRPAPVVAQHLRDLGVDCTDDEVVTSAQAAAGLLAERFGGGAKILVVGGAGLYWALEQEGLIGVGSVDDAPVAVVQGFGPDVGWRLLAEGARAVRSGLPWIATNTDLTVPTPYGPAPGNGTLVAAIAAATKVTPEVAGKPQPPLFLDAARRSGARRPLVVGDRLDTDLEGARAANMDGLAVLTGVSTAVDLMAAAPALRPHLIGRDLTSLMEAHPQPGRVEGGWRCQESVVIERDGRLDVRHSGDDALDLLRAACSASWATMDAAADGQGKLQLLNQCSRRFLLSMARLSGTGSVVRVEHASDQAVERAVEQAVERAGQPVDDGQPEAGMPGPPATGDDLVDEAVQALAHAMREPLEIQVQAFERAHRRLQDRLADVES